jgi:hypothetical protein
LDFCTFSYSQNPVRSIVGLQSNCINNYKELPQPAEYRAGRVNRYLIGNSKVSFLLEVAHDTLVEKNSPVTPEKVASTPLLPRKLVATSIPSLLADEGVPQMEGSYACNEMLLSKYSFIPPFDNRSPEVIGGISSSAFVGSRLRRKYRDSRTLPSINCTRL